MIVSAFLWNRYPSFTPAEFVCRCGTCGRDDVQSELLDRLQAARWISRVPFPITSGVRCEAHNRSVGGAKDSAHCDGRAADVAVDDPEIRWRIVQAAMAAGFRRVGVYRSHVHLDVAQDKAQGVMWTE